MPPDYRDRHPAFMMEENRQMKERLQLVERTGTDRSPSVQYPPVRAPSVRTPSIRGVEDQRSTPQPTQICLAGRLYQATRDADGSVRVPYVRRDDPTDTLFFPQNLDQSD